MKLIFIVATVFWDILITKQTIQNKVLNVLIKC